MVLLLCRNMGGRNKEPEDEIEALLGVMLENVAVNKE